MTTDKYDVVVAGAGMSGLVAALSAAQQGARVLVLEKGGQVGGSMRLAHGFIGTFESVEAAREWIPQGDEFLQEIIIDEVGDARDWLAEAGVKFLPSRQPVEPPVGNAVGEATAQFRGRLMEPPQLIPCLLAALDALDADVVVHSPLHSLLHTPSGVAGLAAWRDGSVAEIEADAVVLATGGFQGNPELVQRYISPHAGNVYLRAQPFSTGDGLSAALAAGGTTSVGMHSFYGHALPAPPARIGQREMLEATQRFGDYAVAVNRNGVRFVDESCGTGEETVNEAIATQPGAEALYVIDAVGAEYDRGLGLPRASLILDRVRDMGARIATAQSLEELVTKVATWGFDAPATLRTLHDYNARVIDDPEQLSPRRQKFRNPLVTPPFYAVPVRSAITFTGGGIAVDTAMAVVSRATSYSTMSLSMHDSRDFVMNTIPGLYAAGADVGGVHVGGYMGGLATALVTGRIAGLSASDALADK